MKVAGRAMNPVLARELTERFRGPRAMILLSIYLLVIGGIGIVIYRAESSIGNGFGGSPVTELAGIGQSLFESTLLLTMVLVLFLVPGFTAGSITGERERQTLLPLQVTLMRPISIVFGKVAAAVAFTVLLVVATLPLLTLSYMIGGIRLIEVFQGIGIVLLTAFAVAVLSVACSAWMRRVQTSTVVAYGLVVIAVVGTIAAFAIARQLDQSQGADTVDPPSFILASNPIVALAEVVGDDPYDFSEFGGPFGGGFGGGFSGGSRGPLSALRDFTRPDVFFEEAAEEAAFEGPAIAVDQFGRQVGVDGGGRPGEDGLSPWVEYVLVVTATVLLCTLTASRRLRTPAKTER
jgi:ABC-type transport system involved in multi-copper enzyme maturation permease subunit